MAEASGSCHDCSLFPTCPVGVVHVHAVRHGAPPLKTTTSLAAGACLHRPGQPATRIHVVQAGLLKTYGVTPTGHEHVRAFHLPGDLVDTEAFDRMQYTGYAQAVEDSLLCSVRPEELLASAEAVPQAKQRLVRHIAQAMTRHEQHTYLLTKLSARERIAAFLCDLSRRTGETDGSTRHFRLTLSRRDMGNYLGLTVETVSRVMSGLQNEGVLHMVGSDVTVRSAARLSELAEPHPGRAGSQRPAGRPSPASRSSGLTGS